jgi:hypothetical protein
MGRGKRGGGTKAAEDDVLIVDDEDRLVTPHTGPDDAASLAAEVAAMQASLGLGGGGGGIGFDDRDFRPPTKKEKEAVAKVSRYAAHGPYRPAANVHVGWSRRRRPTGAAREGAPPCCCGNRCERATANAVDSELSMASCKSTCNDPQHCIVERRGRLCGCDRRRLARVRRAIRATRRTRRRTTA